MSQLHVDDALFAFSTSAIQWNHARNKPTKDSSQAWRRKAHEVRVRHKGNILLCSNFQVGAERGSLNCCGLRLSGGLRHKPSLPVDSKALRRFACLRDTNELRQKPASAKEKLLTELLNQLIKKASQQFTALSLQSRDGGTWRMGCVTGLRGSSKNGLMLTASKCQVPTTALTQPASQRLAHELLRDETTLTQTRGAL